MFTYTCSACQLRQLIFPSQVDAVRPAERGIVYDFTCWCGEARTAVEVTERSQTVLSA